MGAFALAYKQLRRDRRRSAVALAGVAFAVVLMLVQLGFRNALYASAVRFHSHLHGEVFLISPRSQFLTAMQSISVRRLYQALSAPGVAAVVPIYTGLALWKNPVDGTIKRIFVAAFDPRLTAVDLPEVAAHSQSLQQPDVVLFDAASRPEFGPVPKLLKEGTPVETEIQGRNVRVIGLFRLGTSFGIDGSLITSDTNFLRIFPQHQRGLIQFGLIQLKDGADPDAVRDLIAADLPADVEVLTKRGLVDREVKHWASTTAIGFIFTFGAVMGFVVGMVIVYQILFADVADHLSEYATLKAMGYTNAFLYRVVLYEAILLAVAGFLPGLAVSHQLYRLTTEATQLPMHLRSMLVGGTLMLTVSMCMISGVIAVRKIRSADPADIF